MTLDVSFAWKKKMYSQFQTGSRPLNHFPRLGGFFFFFFSATQIGLLPCLLSGVKHPLRAL